MLGVRSLWPGLRIVGAVHVGRLQLHVQEIDREQFQELVSWDVFLRRALYMCISLRVTQE